MKFASHLLTSAAALAACSASSAGFVGWVGVARNAPGAPNYVMVDIFAGVSNASDRFLNVYDMTITTTATVSAADTRHHVSMFGRCLPAVDRLGAAASNEVIQRRVSAGSMTSSTNPRSAAT